MKNSGVQSKEKSAIRTQTSFICVPCEEPPLPHFTQRKCVPLATDEDENWLSEFLCFIRCQLVEVFRASNDDVASRINSKKVVYGQVGIRCRYCAHQPHNERGSRSSCFPSSIDRIYQSLTMTIRDHFVRCPGMPDALKSRFLELKSNTTQGATDSKKYWVDSAKRLGMFDTPKQGISIRQAPRLSALEPIEAPAQRCSSLVTPDHRSISVGTNECMLIDKVDKSLIPEYIYFLLSQVQKVYLTESEQVGNRKTMELSMPGFSCRYCHASGRKGLSRFFPARRRTLPAKVKDLSDHLRRCSTCPQQVKEKLTAFKKQKLDVDPNEDCCKCFFDRVWARLQDGEQTESLSNSSNR